MPPSASKSKKPATFQDRLLQLREAGLKNATFIVPVIAAMVVFLLYAWDILQEGFVGALVALTLTLGPIAMAVPNAVRQTKSRKVKGLIYALGAVWLLGLGFPVYHALFPPKAIAERLLHKGTPSKLELKRSRRLELVTRGGFKGQSLGKGSYAISVQSQGGSTETVAGSFERTIQSTGRRRATRQLVEHVGNVHVLSNRHGPNTTVTLKDIDESLGSQLKVMFRPSGLPPWALILIGCLVVLAALGFDLWFESVKGHTYLFIAAIFAAVFAYSYPTASTQHLVRVTVGAGILAILWAGVVGFLVFWLLKMVIFGKRRKTARR